MKNLDALPPCPSQALSRRTVLKSGVAAAGGLLLPDWVFSDPAPPAPTTKPAYTVDPELARDWLVRWEKYILASERDRACDHEVGEELGWIVSPHIEGFYYGYLATGETRWVDLLIDWSESWIKRGVKEPDGFIGWPKQDGASTESVPGLYTDNMLGEAMALRPAVLMAATIAKSPLLKAKYAAHASHYLEVAQKVYEKWEARGCWREIKEGGVWVVPTFGIDRKTNIWTPGYDRRQTDGFTLPDNKQNHIARWLIALHDATGNPIYRQRAQSWWQTMRSRMRLHEDGKYCVWNYWDPAGPWDYKPDGSTKHWVGVHPNGGYYEIDLQSIVAAYEHRLVFEEKEIGRLVATNRDYMWDQSVQHARFKRIDGEQPDKRWKDSPGVLWDALLPYDATLRKIFEANHKPDSWGGMIRTPEYLSGMGPTGK